MHALGMRASTPEQIEAERLGAILLAEPAGQFVSTLAALTISAAAASSIMTGSGGR